MQSKMVDCIAKDGISGAYSLSLSNLFGMFSSLKICLKYGRMCNFSVH